MNTQNLSTHGQPAVDWLAKRTCLSPNRLALIDASSGQRITYAEWNRRANKVANALHGLGLRKGDRVAILSTNRLEYLDTLFACQKGGYILQALNWRLTVAELDQLIQIATPRVLIYTASLGDKVAELCEKIDVDNALALDDPLATNHMLWTDWVGRGASTQPVRESLCMHDPWILCYTGGTTGLPKAAILTHSNITWNAINTITSWGITAHDTTFLNAPLFHTGGLNVFTTPLVHVGGCSIVCQGFDVDQTFDLISYHGVTMFFAVPTMFIVMQQHPRWADMDFSNCHLVISGGAPCPAPVFERFFEKGIPFKTGYGLTEAGPNTFILPDDDAQRKIGSVGFPMMHIDTRIVDAEGNQCQPGDIGELLIRGPHVTPGYWNNPEATRQTIVNGWLHTGDLARYDEEGYNYIVGRSKDMIISGGENIYPAEIESAMLGHPDIHEATLIGISDQKWGEVGRALVVLRPDSYLKPNDFLEYMRHRLAGYKVPKSVVFVDSLPKTAAGKINKQLLQQQYGGEL